MTIHVPLSPPLERFVREQLATGRFQSEREVILAALQLLAEQSSTPSGQGLSEAISSQPPASTSIRRLREDRREPRRAESMPGHTTAANPPVRRSPRGLLADLPSHLSAEDIREARHAMWTDFFGGGAG